MPRPAGGWTWRCRHYNNEPNTTIFTYGSYGSSYTHDEHYDGA